MEHAESLVIQAILAFKLAVEVTGAVVIGIGCGRAIVAFARTRLDPAEVRFARVRLDLARYLALGLEFQLAADILVTAVAPSWDQLGKLAAIAAIRTALNFFLAREAREMREESSLPGGDRVVAEPARAAG